MKTNLNLIRLLVLLLYMITSIILIYSTFSDTNALINNFILLKILVIYFLFVYSLITIKILIEISRNYVKIKHKIIIYFQIYNLLSFFIGWVFLNSIQFNLRNFFELSFTDKVLNILFFPGSYFSNNFDCFSDVVWYCFGNNFVISTIFDTIIFIVLGFLIGLLVEKFREKK